MLAIRDYLLLFNLALVLMLAGCVPLGCERIQDSQLLVYVWHGSGGPGSVVSVVQISNRGRIFYLSPRGSKLCARLTSREMSRIQRQLSREDLQRAALEGERRGIGYADFEEIGVKTSQWSAAMPAELMPTEISNLVGTMDDIVSEHFGRQFIDTAKPASK